MKQYLPFLFAVLLIAGCATSNIVRQSSTIPDPGDTNYWSTNVYNYPNRQVVIDSNQIYTTVEIRSNSKIRLTVFNTVSGHIYDLCYRTNSITRPLPTTVNLSGWKIYGSFVGASGGVVIDNISMVQLNTFFWSFDEHP